MNLKFARFSDRPALEECRAVSRSDLSRNHPLIANLKRSHNVRGRLSIQRNICVFDIDGAVSFSHNRKVG